MAKGCYFLDELEWYAQFLLIFIDLVLNINLAVQFEQGKFDECIATCEKAIEEGRPLRADYKLVAKAYGRIGNAYQRKGDLDNAISFYNKSLLEHRTPDTLNKLRDAEKEKSTAAATAYINPELSEKAREEGNVRFKAGNWAGAVESYTEAINRHPTDPRAYNNRALCLTKLVALPDALKDAEKAIELDPKFSACLTQTLSSFVLTKFVLQLRRIFARVRYYSACENT